MRKTSIFITCLLMIIALSTNIFATDSLVSTATPDGSSILDETSLPPLSNLPSSLDEDMNNSTISNKQVNINTNTNVNNVQTLQSVNKTNSTVSSNSDKTKQENSDVSNNSSKVGILLGIIVVAGILFVVYISRKK